jgi:hypothetical protein
MINRGMIFLVDWEDRVIRGKKYSCKSKRRESIAQWEREYPAAFRFCYLIIVPEADCRFVGYNGITTTKLEKREAPVPKFDRPPAVYDNCKSLYILD